jgi:class 3 adenylate cyclase/tetratricopeptide (TPR) repeat protein
MGVAGFGDLKMAATVTMVFTDLVGSTALLSRVGEERAEELRREHFGLLRETIGKAGGREVKNLGDGLMVVVASAADGVAAAVAIQQAFERRNRDSSEPLLVRVGVALGDADVEDGDYFGVPVVEASRLCAKARGGEILVTDVVRALTGSRGGFEFEALGAIELKGLDQPVAVCRVVWLPRGLGDELAIALPSRVAAASVAAFVGRAREREGLNGSLKTVAAGERRVVLVSGEPGIGKTALSAAFAREAFENGAVVLYGRCDEDLGIPYQPWAEALTHLVRHAPDDVLAAHVDARGSELVRLAPDLATRTTVAPTSSSDGESERYLLFGAVVDVLTRLSMLAPIVLVLDDLHWADRTTVQLLRHVASADAPLRLLVIGTFRESDVGTDHPLAEALAALHRESGVERLALRGLGDDELLALLETIAGHEMPEDGIALRDALLAETEGNPFFAGEMLRHLAETRAIYQDDGGRWVASPDLRTSGLPVSIREVIGRRVARLGAQTQGALSLAAVIGRDFDVELLARVAEVDDDTVIDLCDQAVTAAVLIEAEVPGRYTFAHALIEHALYESLSGSRRARAHRSIAEALEEICGADPAERIGELAYHWALATQPQDALKAMAYAQRAGDRALAQLAPDEALRWYRDALDLLGPGPGSDTARCDLLIGLGTAQLQAGDAAHRQTLLDAAALARRTDDTDRLVDAALANHRGSESAAGEVDTERVEVLTAALDATAANTTTRARLLATLAVELTYSADLERVAALADEAIAIARRLDDPATLVQALNSRHTALRLPETLADRIETTREAVALADDLADPWRRFSAHRQRLQAAVESGDRAERDAGVAACHEDATRVGQPFLRWVDTQNRAMEALLNGDPDRAEILAEAAFAIGTECGQPDAFTIYAAQLFDVRVHQGRVGEIADVFAEGVAENPGLALMRVALARVYLDADRPEEARALLDEVGVDLPRDELWLVGTSIWAQVAARLGVLDTAAILFERLAPWAGQIPTAVVAASEPIDHCLGELASVLGRVAEADAHFAAAEATARGFGAPFYIARTLVERARLDFEHDPAIAQQRAAEALAIAAEHGYARVERDARAMLERTE